MLDTTEFFERLAVQLKQNLPFVAYRDPRGKTGVTRALLQFNQEFYKAEDLSCKGFVFAPFDETMERVLIPQEKSEIVETIFPGEEGLQIYSIIDHSNFQALEKQQHEQLVQKGIDAIHAGKFEKVVLSRKEVIETGSREALNLFKNLLKRYPTAYVYLFFHPQVGTWTGATPEVLLQVERNRFKTMALAGTQRFKGTTQVVWGEKEKIEQLLVTNAILENLKDSSVNVKTTGPYTDKAGELLHLRTDIEGEIISKTQDASIKINDSSKSLVDNQNLEKLILAIHPTPAVCGLPRVPAKKFILENEKYDREFYAGFLGEVNMKFERKRSQNRRNQENQAYASHSTSSSLYVNLRCMKLTATGIELFVGGGITRDSEPSAEWEETQNKASTMKAVLDIL